MSIRNLGILALSALSLTACVETNTSQITESSAAVEMEAAPTNVESKVRQYLNATLKDPGSLQNFRITKGPQAGVLNYGAFTRGPRGKAFGNELWYVCAQFNAKNGFGGYVGTSVRPFFFYQNQVVEMYDAQTSQEPVSRFSC